MKEKSREPMILCHRSIIACFMITLYLLIIAYEQIYVINTVINNDSPQLPNNKSDASTTQLPTTCLPLPPPHAEVPRIYLHIGPHKTGTTSLQDYFACNTAFLKKHDTYYLGKINMYDVVKCNTVPPDFLRPLIQTPSYQGLSKLQYMIHHYRKRGSNVIMSSEDIFDVPRNYTIELFANITTIYPVVGYRRHYEWLLSSYRYNYGEPKWYDMDIWRSWDGHGDIPTFRMFAQQYRDKLHPTIDRLNKFYEMQQTRVKTCPQVLNFHLGDVTNEFMKLITLEDSVPASVFTNVNDVRRTYSVDSEILALKLYREFKVHNVLSRRVVVDVLQHKMSLVYSNSTPPLDCLNPAEEDMLLQQTKAAEKQLLPDFYHSPSGESTIDKEFQAVIDKSLLCNINFHEMLRDPVWDQTLLRLRKGRLRQDDFKPK